jgi:hypothetical protein
MFDILVRIDSLLLLLLGNQCILPLALAYAIYRILSSLRDQFLSSVTAAISMLVELLLVLGVVELKLIM